MFLFIQSVEMSTTIYHSNWLDKDVKTRKFLILIQMRSQRPLKISAYKIATVSFTSFFKVCIHYSLSFDTGQGFNDFLIKFSITDPEFQLLVFHSAPYHVQECCLREDVCYYCRYNY